MRSKLRADPSSSSSSGGPQSAAPRPKISLFRDESSAGRFVPDRIFLKGWAPYVAGRNKADGISEDDANIMYASLMSNIAPSAKVIVERYSAPYFRNHQIILFLVSGTSREAAWRLTVALNDCIKTQNKHVNGRKIFAQLDQEDWKKSRNSRLAAASNVLEAAVPAGTLLHKDWAAGELWSTAPSTRSMGRWDRTNGWVWNAPNITLLGLSVENLVVAPS